jgi:chorismate mutase
VLEYTHVNTETRNKAQPVPKLKPATLHAKIAALDAELSELQSQRQQLIDGASDSPLIGQYIATKKSGGTAFSGKSEKQAMHDYYALVDATGAFIRYISKQEVTAYRNRIHLGKKVAKLNRAIARCDKRLNEYKSKLLLAEQIKSPTVANSNLLSEAQDNLSDQSVTGSVSLYVVESDAWIVSETA